MNGEKVACPAGKYGDVVGLHTDFCSGWCPEAYYCPIGTIAAKQFPCTVGKYSRRGQAVCFQCQGPTVTGPQTCYNNRLCCNY